MQRRDFLKLTIGAAALAPLASQAFGRDLGSVARVVDVFYSGDWPLVRFEKPKGSTSLQISKKIVIAYDAYDVSGPSWIRTGTFRVVSKPSSITAAIDLLDGFVKPGAMIWPK